MSRSFFEGDISLAWRFLFWFCISALLPLALFGYLSLHQHEAELRYETLSRMSRLADKKVLQIKTYLAERSHDVQLLARSRLADTAVSNLLSVYTRYGAGSTVYIKASKPFDKEFSVYIGAGQDALFYDVFLITPQGEIVYTYKHEADFATNLINGPYRNSELAQAFRDSLMTLESSVSDFEFYAPSSEPAAFVSAPIIRDGVLLGVIAFQLDTQRMYQVAMDNAGLGATGETVLAKLTGADKAVFVAPLRHDPQAAMQRELDLTTTAVPMRYALLGQRGYGVEIDYAGQQIVAAWRYLPELRWGMVVKMDADEAFAPICQQRKNLLGILLVLALLGGFTAFYFGRQMVVRLKSFAQNADEIARGDFNQRLDEFGTDEISVLARSFNRMTGNLQALYRTLEDRIKERTRELNVTNEQLQEEVIEREQIERALRESQEFFRTLSAVNPVGIFRADASGSFVFVNPRWCEIAGIGQDVAIGNGWLSAIHQDDREKVRTKWTDAIKEQHPFSLEYRFVQPDGSFVWVYGQSSAVRDDGGNITGYVGTITDVTERKQFEEVLRLERDQNQHYFDTTPAIMVALDASGKITMINNAALGLLGYAENELLGRNWFETCLVQPEGMEIVYPMFRRAMAGEIKLPEEFENSILCRDGSQRLIDWRNTYLNDANGHLFGTLSSGVDITERKQAEEMLKRHKRVLDTTSDGFWMLDEMGNIQMVNQAYANISGYSMEELAHMHISQLEVNEKSIEEVKAHIDKIILKGSDKFETRHRHKDGHEIDIEVSTLFLRETRQFAAFLRDISERKQAQLELLHNQDLLNEAQRLGQLGSWELNLVSGELRWSDELYRIFELDPARFQPSYENFLNMIHPDDRDRVNQDYTHSLESHQPYDIVHRLQLADGRIKWVREHCTSEFDVSGKPLRSVGAVQDITEQKRAEDALRVAAVTFETHEAILITDANANIIRVNRAFQGITGYTPAEVLGKNPRILSSGRQDKAFYAEMWRQLLDNGAWGGEIWDKRKNGQIYPKRMNITAVKNEQGQITEYVAIFSDITAHKQAEEEIRKLAFYDTLTKLPNRRLLLDRFRLALSVSARSHQYGAVLFLDMDKFKTLNDTLGHDYGDMMLVEVARRIQSCMRETDTVARLGGDEFVVLIEEISTKAEEALQRVALVAEKIRASLAAPYLLNDHEHHSSPSIGVCLYCGNEEPVDVLLKHADMAMYQVKDSGRNAVRFFDPAMQQAVETHASMEMDLRHAIPDHQLSLHYQIQLDNEHRPLGAEALVRWVHPTRGMVSPVEFIPIAEESSLILDIGQWVLETACRQLAMWSKHEQTRDLIIAVNVSAQEFRLQDFVGKVAALVRAHGVNPSLLKLELTESVILNDVADIVAKMHALKAMGIKLSLDDFGTGYSSLSYLKQLPLDQLKIDQSFVRDIATDVNDAVMVKTIIDMANNFRLNVIAEGVETEAQLAFLKENGCMAYQGYLFSKPVPIEEFGVLLDKI